MIKPPLTVPMWKWFLARFLGRRVVSEAGGWRMTAYHWRGHIYIHRFVPTGIRSES